MKHIQKYQNFLNEQFENIVEDIDNDIYKIENSQILKNDIIEEIVKMPNGIDYISFYSPSCNKFGIVLQHGANVKLCYFTPTSIHDMETPEGKMKNVKFLMRDILEYENPVSRGVFVVDYSPEVPTSNEVFSHFCK